MDFGIAHRLETDDAELTQPGIPIGTPAYMSPEQIQGIKDDLGPATDIYALGVILYELMTGRRPFEGAMMMVLHDVLHKQPLPPSKHQPNLDPSLEKICLQAMAKPIKDRHASMEDLANDLEEFLNPPAPRPPTGKRPVLVALAAALLVVLLGVIVFVVTDKGTLKIEGFVPEMEVHVDGQKVRIEKVGEPIEVRAGEHTLLITRGDILVKAPKSFEVRRGEEKVVTLTLIDPSPPIPIPIPIPGKAAETKPETVVVVKKPAEEVEKKEVVEKAASPIPRIEVKNPTDTAREDAIKACNRGNVWYSKNDYEKALADYNEAIRLDPNFELARSSRNLTLEAKNGSP